MFNTSNKFKTFFLVVCVAVMVGCSKEPISERWIGYYSFQSHPVKFPLYVDIVIEGESVHGTAIDGSNEKAAVTGTVIDGYYSLLLHPEKHGNNKGQDVWYKGSRNDNNIVGEWVHVVGPSGPWSATLTTLGPVEAIKPYIKPCKKAETKGNHSESDNCENAA